MDHTPVPMDSDERCFLTELIKTQCAHCRQPSRPVFAEALFTTPDSDDEDNDVVATFHARYPGWCAACERAIHEGDWIARLGSGAYVCDGCAP